MTRERGLTPSLPAHSEDIVGHVHVKKCKKKNTSAKTAGGQRLLRPTVSSRARARSVSPKSGPWVPAPGKATRGGRITWQGTGQRSEVNHVRNSDLSTDEEERFGGEVRKYEKKINNLINEVGTLRNEVVLQKALQEIEQKEDLLNTSSRMLQHHEDELEHVQEELHQVEAELVVSESENKLLRKNMELIAEEAEITKTQKEQLNYERERLMKKLIEAELDGQAASHQVIELRDLIRQLRDEQRISSVDQARLSKQKDLFLKALADFEATNRALQHLLRDQHRLEASGMRMSEQRDILLRKLADCDLMNERMNNQLLDCESLIADLKSQLQVEKEERLVLSNLQGSLESTRGHLQKQLRTKEADCNRMSVQIRSLEGQLSQERMEKDHFQEVASSLKHKTDRDKEALKKAARAQKSRAERLEEELSRATRRLTDLECHDCEHATYLTSANSRAENLIREKQLLASERDQDRARITELEALLDRMEDTAKSQNDSLTVRLHEKIAENAGLKLECERLKVSRVRIDGGESNTRVEEKERLQRDGEQELEKVKQRLHQRLQELEPLPELLRATELRLQEANEKVVSHEKRNIENTRIIAELTAKLDCNSESLDQFRSRCSDSQDSNRSLQSKYETLERRLRELEEKNLELHASQVKLQESLHQESMRLEEKARENASLTRQLENALTDGRKHNEQSRDRYLTKERTYQSRIVDLESQLSQMRADQTRLKREKEENERKFNARLYDLKDRLEQCQSSNRSMQNYVQFLKNSYSNVFGDTASSLPSPISPVKPYP
uniref:Outer dense fiber protein 2 n=2 Tax=Arion vulgaris TaxID=1028688 RepID=A0A0B7A1L7_9EUPU